MLAYAGALGWSGWALYGHVDNFLFARYSDTISPARGAPLTAEIMWFMTADTARRGRRTCLTKIFVDVTTVFLTTGRWWLYQEPNTSLTSLFGRHSLSGTESRPADPWPLP